MLLWVYLCKHVFALLFYRRILIRMSRFVCIDEVSFVVFFCAFVMLRYASKRFFLSQANIFFFIRHANLPICTHVVYVTGVDAFDFSILWIVCDRNKRRKL